MDEKIKEIIEIQGGYTSYVDLKLELFDDSRNIARMARYRPVTSHRQAFERLTRSLNVKDKRCYLLTGAYGTGKSHLCLMFANYLQTPAGEKPMPDFFENYLQVAPAQAENLRAMRATGRYLVALCEWGGHSDFEEIVLRAVDQALRREGFGEDFDTHYLQAIKKIEEWEAFYTTGDARGRFFPDFQAALHDLQPPQDVEKFKRRLRDFDFAALEDFKRVHLNLTTASFTYDKSNLLAILTNTLASAKFKERFLGILVLFDEFGDTMDRGNLSPKMFQQFAQLAAETPADCARLIFVGTAHKPLTAYAKAYSATEFRTASDRVEEVQLTPDGVEDIISAIVVPQKSSPLWQNKVAARASVFDGFLTDCTRLKLFDWLKGPKVRANIIENIYPMHPMATYAMLQLARDIASTNRSVYTFFSGDLGGYDEAGSYGWYINNTPIETGGRLNLYTADLLLDYFAAALSSDNRELREPIREKIKDYENSRRELNRLVSQDATTKLQFLDDPLLERVLRLMLIYDIIGVPNRLDNLLFGLYRTSEAEKTEVRNRLNQLAAKGVLYFAKDTQVYEFKKSKSVDLDRLIDEYKKEPNNEPANLVAELNTLIPLDRKNDLYLEAKDYNLSNSEDKRLERRFARPAEMAAEIDTPQGKRNFFHLLENELEREAKNSDCEGYAVYAVCETEEEIQKAKECSARNQSDRIVVAVPKNPVPLRDAVMDLRALLHIEGSDEAKNFTMQDNAVLNARLNGDTNRPGAYDVLRGLRNKLMSARDIVWYAKYAAPLPVDENKQHDAANRVMDTLYSNYHNLFTHDDFNKLRAKIDRTKSIALKEAVEKLLDYTQPIILDTSFAQQRGDRRYLQQCLLTYGVLRQVKADGSKLRCEFEANSDKYSKYLPSLAAMISEIKNLPPNTKVNLVAFATKYRQPPYGQGPVAMALSLACIRRFFGDGILIKADENAIGEMPLHSFDEVIDLFEGRRPNAFLSYRPLRDEEQRLVDEVFKVFGQAESAADVAQRATVSQTHQAVKAWWDGLPPLARVGKLYPSQTQPYVAQFIEALTKIAARDAYTFLFDDLPETFGDGAGLAVASETVERVATHLPQMKQAIEAQLQQVEDRIFSEIRQIFEVRQHTDSDIVDAVTSWYNSLDTNQRDSHAPWHTNDSKPLVVYLKAIAYPRETFLKTIPASTDYGMKPVADWITDRVSEYVERLRRGKQLIDQSRLKVESPEVIFTGDCEQSGGQVSFKGVVKVTLRPKSKNAKIYVVEGNADPTDPNAQREELAGDAPLEIHDHKTIHYAVQDADGNWGRVETLELINENKKYELSEPKQRSLLKDQTVNFIFPQDPQSFAVTCRSLFSLALQRNLLTPEQLEATVQAILTEMRKA